MRAPIMLSIFCAVAACGESPVPPASGGTGTDAGSAGGGGSGFLLDSGGGEATTEDGGMSDVGAGGADGGASTPDAGDRSDAGPPCLSDSDCAPPQTVCEAGACVLGCTSVNGLMCGPDEVCDTGTGRCVALPTRCRDDSDCAPPQTICESAQCIPGCGQPGGLQCRPPQQCDTSTGRCGGGSTCVDDSLEDNDSVAAATNPTTPNQAGLSSCPGDDDYFRIVAGPQDLIVVSVSFSHAEGNIDVELLDSAGAVVAASNTTGDLESVTFTAPIGGDYYARVYLTTDSGSAPGNQYAFNYSAGGAACTADMLEPNDTPVDATLVTTGALTGLNACATDDDVFAVRPAVGEELGAVVTFTAAEGNVGLSLYDWNGQLITDAPASSGQAVITHNVIVSNWHYFRVFLRSDAGSVPGCGYSFVFVQN